MDRIDLTKPQIIESYTPRGWADLPADARVTVNGNGNVAVTAAFAKAAEVHTPSVPVDLVNNRTPSVWNSDFGTDTYDWQ